MIRLKVYDRPRKYLTGLLLNFIFENIYMHHKRHISQIIITLFNDIKYIQAVSKPCMLEAAPLLKVGRPHPQATLDADHMVYECQDDLSSVEAWVQRQNHGGSPLLPLHQRLIALPTHSQLIRMAVI
jgi:hypothetical protein